jgi:hypothetical protein
MAAEGSVANQRFSDTLKQSSCEPDFGSLEGVGKLPGNQVELV